MFIIVFYYNFLVFVAFLFIYLFIIYSFFYPKASLLVFHPHWNIEYFILLWYRRNFPSIIMKCLQSIYTEIRCMLFYIPVVLGQSFTVCSPHLQWLGVQDPKKVAKLLMPTSKYWPNFPLKTIICTILSCS